MKKSKRNRYSEAFKREAVLRVMEENSSSHSVSRELGVSQPTLSRWIRKFKEEGSVSQDKDELKKMKAKVKRLQDENDILKKATIFLAKHVG